MDTRGSEAGNRPRTTTMQSDGSAGSRPESTPPTPATATVRAAMRRVLEAAQAAEGFAQEQADGANKILTEVLPIIDEALATIDANLRAVQQLVEDAQKAARTVAEARGEVLEHDLETENTATDAANRAAEAAAQVKEAQEAFDTLNTKLNDQLTQLQTQVQKITKELEQAKTVAEATVTAAADAKGHASAAEKHAADAKAAAETTRTVQDLADQTVAAQTEIERISKAAETALSETQDCIEQFEEKMKSALAAIQEAQEDITNQCAANKANNTAFTEKMAGTFNAFSETATDLEQALQTVHQQQKMLRRRRVGDAIKALVRDLAITLLFGVGLAVAILCMPAMPPVLATMALIVASVGTALGLGSVIMDIAQWWQAAREKPLPDRVKKNEQSSSVKILGELAAEEAPDQAVTLSANPTPTDDAQENPDILPAANAATEQAESVAQRAGLGMAR